MQTNLADFIKNTPAGDEAEAILRACVHCGFCTATCPTYQLLGDELDGDADAAGSARIRQAVAAAGGHATLFRGGDKAVGVFHPLAPAIATIHQRLRQAFDPAGIFNPHRMT